MHFIFWYYILTPALSFLLFSFSNIQSVRPFFSILSMILFNFLNSTLFFLFERWFLDFKFKGIPSFIIFIGRLLLELQAFYIHLGNYDLLENSIILTLSYFGGSIISITVLFLIITIISEQKKGKIGLRSGKYIAWGLMFLYVISLLLRLMYTLIPLTTDVNLNVIIMNILNTTVGLIGIVFFLIGLEKDMNISTH